MYYDDFDHHLDRCCPGRDDLLPSRSRWARRAMGFAFLSLLVLMHGCG